MFVISLMYLLGVGDCDDSAPSAYYGGHTAHRWVRDRHTHAASAGVRGVGAFAGGEAHLNVTRFKQQRSDSPATAYL